MLQMVVPDWISMDFHVFETECYAPLRGPAPAFARLKQLSGAPLKELYTMTGCLEARSQEAWRPCRLAGLAWPGWAARWPGLAWMMLEGVGAW